MTTPADSDKVSTRLRLGWALAELQGRYRREPLQLATEPLPANAGTALALRPEHTDAELREQILDVFCKVFADVCKDHPGLDSDSLSGNPSFTKEITDQAQAIAALDSPKDMTSAQWNDFTAVIRRLDGHVQNTLAGSSDSELSGYLLGRGLAETFWALQPKNEPPSAPSAPNALATASKPAAKAADENWTFLFGTERVAELQRLLGRLSSYFDRYTAPSISGSLCVWQEVARNEGWREQENAQQDLYDQTRRWYELLVIGQDATTLVKPFAFLRNVRGAVSSARAFLPQLLLGFVSIAVLFGIVAAANTSWGKAAGAAIGVFGLSLTSLTAKAKSSAQAMTTRLQQDSYSDLVAIAITIVPPRTDRDREGQRPFTRRFESPTRRAVSSAIRARPLTTAVAVNGASS
jgi:hypothetical protein